MSRVIGNCDPAREHYEKQLCTEAHELHIARKERDLCMKKNYRPWREVDETSRYALAWREASLRSSSRVEELKRKVGRFRESRQSKFRVPANLPDPHRSRETSPIDKKRKRDRISAPVPVHTAKLGEIPSQALPRETRSSLEP